MLTDVTIRQLIASPPLKRREIADGKAPGLYFIVQPSGAASWAVRYRADGLSRKLTLGALPAVDLKTARRKATEALGAIAGGKDPAGDRKAAREAARAEKEATVDLVETVAESFIKRYVRVETRDAYGTERLLNGEIVGRWRGMRLSSITRPMIHDMMDAIADRGAPVVAKRAFAQFRVMCSWAVQRGIIDRSPCDGVKPPKENAPRDRVLSDDELNSVWTATDALGEPWGSIVRLLILTGQRRSEVAEMEWRELDLDGATWTIPGGRAKNKRAHQVPLSPAAADILRKVKRVSDKFVFSTDGRVPVCNFSKPRLRLDKALGESDAARWTVHDLRRTCASNLQKLGVRVEVIEAALNHISGSMRGIVGTYQTYKYQDEARAGLDAWAKRLAEIVSGEAQASNIVEFSRETA